MPGAWLSSGHRSPATDRKAVTSGPLIFDCWVTLVAFLPGNSQDKGQMNASPTSRSAGPAVTDELFFRPVQTQSSADSGRRESTGRGDAEGGSGGLAEPEPAYNGELLDSGEVATLCRLLPFHEFRMATIALDPRAWAAMTAVHAAWTDSTGDHGNSRGTGYVIRDVPELVVQSSLGWTAAAGWVAFDQLKAGADRWIVSLLRAIFGNPLHPVVFDASWRTSTVVALASQMYASRDFSPMPILTDSLQDAGCEDERILGHCRGPGPHVLGCWVCDLILGKE